MGKKNCLSINTLTTSCGINSFERNLQDSQKGQKTKQDCFFHFGKTGRDLHVIFFCATSS